MKNTSLFEGQRVAILAPGSSLSNQTIQKKEFDVICAVGNWFRMRRILIPTFVPSVDVIYPGPVFFRNLLFLIYNSDHIPLLRTAKEHNIRISPEIAPKTTFYNFDFNQKCEEVGCNLTTGMAAIIDVLSCNPKSVSLFGFDFYQSETPYISGYTSKFDTRVIQATKGNLSGHNQTILLNFFIKNVFPFLTVDKLLLEVINKAENG